MSPQPDNTCAAYFSGLSLTPDECRDLLEFLVYARDKAGAERDDAMYRRLTDFIARLAMHVDNDFHSPL